MCPYIQIFNITIRSYYLLIGTAFVIDIILAVIIAPKYGFDRADVLRFSAIGACLIMFGGKAGYFFTDGYKEVLAFIVQDTRTAPSLYELFNGRRMIGSLVFGIASAYIYTKIAKLDLMDFMALYVVYAPLGTAIGRIGCFLNGCCYGTEYHGIFAMTFPTSGSVHPLQLYESFGFLVVFAVLVIMRKRNTESIYINSTFIILFCFIRFMTEYLRPDANWILPFMTVNQLMALCVSAAMALYIVLYQNNKSRGKENEKKKKNRAA